MKQFVLFPFSLYKNNPYWVPPIVKDEIASFDPAKNPVFQNAEAQFFIAFKNGKIVGRVAAIINWIEVEKQQLKKMRFGWFDVIDDLAVSQNPFKQSKRNWTRKQLAVHGRPCRVQQLRQNRDFNRRV